LPPRNPLRRRRPCGPHDRYGAGGRNGDREGHRIIDETAHAARLAIQRQANTHRTENTHLVGHVGQVPGTQPFAVPDVPSLPGQVLPAAIPAVGIGAAPAGAGEVPAAAAPAGVTGPIEQLRQLGQLRDAGILTAEEFDGKKADILSRM
jgi:hypothetical protein